MPRFNARRYWIERPRDRGVEVRLQASLNHLFDIGAKSNVGGQCLDDVSTVSIY